MSEIKDGEHLLPRDGRIKLEKPVDRFAAFEEVDQALDGHTGAPEAGGAAHALRIHPNCLVQPAFLFGGHNLKVGDIRNSRKSNGYGYGCAALTWDPGSTCRGNGLNV